MRNPIIKPIVVTIVFATILVLIGAGTKKAQSKKIVDTKVFTCNTSGLAKTYIDMMTKKGYQVQQIVSQNVATSIDNSYQYYGTRSNYRDIRGDFLIVLTKEIEAK